MRTLLVALIVALTGCAAATTADPADPALPDTVSALRSGDLSVAEAQESLTAGGAQPQLRPVCWQDQLCAACCQGYSGGAHCCVICEGDNGQMHCD